MRKLILVILAFIIILSGCTFADEIETTTEYKSPYATDVNGELVPVHDDVDESLLDPTLFYLGENSRMKYADTSRSTMTGIDVSVFQGDIDWNAVAADGIDFVILRIGYRGYGQKGIMEVDNNFYKNYDGAVSAGLKVGVYFYSQAVNPSEAREEARFVLDALGNRALDFPIVYDWEYVDNPSARTADMTSDEITACAVNFCDEIIKASHEVMIYFNREIGYFEYNLTDISDYDFWLAEYDDYPTFIYKFDMWQYTDSGRVNGIASPVDINIFFPDENFTQYG